ncbi:hypothetical protein FA15DRAFT_703196 [Coprinopsis marcescibilis]|nr:hypothetical protein FA15DRAFT_703196 [Coprinopsis marcescibilis]
MDINLLLNPVKPLPNPKEIAMSPAARHEAAEHELVTHVYILCGWIDRETGVVCDMPIKGGRVGVQRHIDRTHPHNGECEWELDDDVEEEYAAPCRDRRVRTLATAGTHIFRKRHVLRGYSTINNMHVRYRFRTLACGGCGREFPEYVGGSGKVYEIHVAKSPAGPGCAAALAELAELRRLRAVRGFEGLALTNPQLYHAMKGSFPSLSSGQT